MPQNVHRANRKKSKAVCVSLMTGAMAAGTLVGCKRGDAGSSTQFAILDKPDEGHTLLGDIFANPTRLNVCLVNEAPESNGAWLAQVEKSFAFSLKNWLVAGATHPKYPLPGNVPLTFVRLPASAYVQKSEALAKRMQAHNGANRAKLEGLMNASDEDFKEKYDEYKAYFDTLLARNDVQLEGCAAPAVTLVTFSDREKLRVHLDTLKKIFKSMESILKPEEEEAFMKKFVRIIYKGQMSYEEYKRTEELAKANGDELTRAYAMPSPPELFFPRTSYTEEYLDGIMTHEIGHLLGLGDVYIDRDLSTSLEAHPPAVMGLHYAPEVQGRIQPDDVRGLMAAITFAKTNVKECGKDHHTFANTNDSRSLYTAYCLPDGFEQANFGGANASVASTTIGHSEVVAPPLVCPAGMVLSDSSGACCPESLPRFDAASERCVKGEGVAGLRMETGVPVASATGGETMTTTAPTIAPTIAPSIAPSTAPTDIAASAPTDDPVTPSLGELKMTFIGAGKYRVSFDAAGFSAARVIVDGRWTIYSGAAGSVAFDHTFSSFGKRTFEVVAIPDARFSSVEASRRLVKCIGRENDCAP